MRSILRFIVWTVIIVGTMIGLARATAIRWWRVPTDDPWLVASVAPTLRTGDLVILWRLTRPTQGDLVLCPEPRAPERIVVGRVMGASNDEVTTQGAGVKLNGQSPPAEGSCPSFEVADPKKEGTLLEHPCSIEDLDGHLHMRGEAVGQSAIVPPPKVTVVEPGRFFLVSDNRQYFFDSRDYGTVEAASCKETVVFRLWSKEGYFNPNGRFEIVR